MRTDAGHDIGEDVREPVGRQLADVVVEEHEVPHAEAAYRRKLRGATPIPTAGTDQRDIDARGCVVGERVAGEVGGLVGIRHDAQHSKGHIG